MANSFTDSYSSDVPLQAEDAQNTAQRSDKKSTALMDDHKEVSSQDYKPSVPQSSSSDVNSDTGMNTKTGEVGRVVSNSVPSHYGKEIGSAFIPSKHETDFVMAAKRKLEVEDLARHIQEKESIPWNEATKRADGFMTLQSAENESKIAMANAKIAKQTKDTQALTARAKFEEEFAGISPADPEAPKKYNSVMAKYAPSLAGSSHFKDANDMLNQALTHTQVFERYGAAEQRRQEAEDLKQRAGLAIGIIGSASEQELNDFIQSEDYKGIVGHGMVGRAVTQSISNRKKELGAIKSGQMGAGNADMEIVGYKDGQPIYRHKKVDSTAAMMAAFTGDPNPQKPTSYPPQAIQPPAEDSDQLPGDEGLTQTDSSLGMPSIPITTTNTKAPSAPVSNAGVFPSGQIEIDGAKTRKPLSEIAPQ